MDQFHLFVETIAAITVIASVIYLGLQIRDSSRSNRALAVATLLNQYDSPNGNIVENKEVARMFRLRLEGLSNLDDDEQFQVICLSS